MDQWKKHFVLSAAAVVACIPLVAHAADSMHSMPAPSKEQREKMALVHEKMATCLRSDRTIADCHHEMQSSCSEVMGKEHCQMMEHKMKGHHHPVDSDKAVAPAK
jgi:hypothetical protein